MIQNLGMTAGVKAGIPGKGKTIIAAGRLDGKTAGLRQKRIKSEEFITLSVH